MYRNHFNTLKLRDIRTPGKLPFYSWQCLTISTVLRNVDLVIPHEINYNILVKYLLYRMNSYDGKKDSAIRLLYLMRYPHRTSLADPFNDSFSQEKEANKEHETGQ
jgi:hypothetical protein